MKRGWCFQTGIPTKLIPVKCPFLSCQQNVAGVSLQGTRAPPCSVESLSTQLRRVKLGSGNFGLAQAQLAMPLYLMCAKLPRQRWEWHPLPCPHT